MNGSVLSWNEASPANAESAGSGATILRSLQTSIRFGLDDEHNWPSAGGDNVGYHRFGSARPFYGTQSRVSSADTDGRLYLTSDTSRLFAPMSTGTVLLGGCTVNSIGTYPDTVPQRHMWMEEFGTVLTHSSGSTMIFFPNSGFSGVPYTLLASYSIASTTTASPNVNVSVDTTISTGTRVRVSATAQMVDGTSLPCAATVFWRSLGTRVL